MFEKASRLKLRIDTSIGPIMVEDLWDVPLTARGNLSLDNIAKALNKEVKDGAEESFVTKKSSSNTLAELKFDIVKHVIDVKLAEAEVQKNAAANKAKKERIMAIIAGKEDEDLKSKSTDELKALLDDI